MNEVVVAPTSTSRDEDERRPPQGEITDHNITILQQRLLLYSDTIDVGTVC